MPPKNQTRDLAVPGAEADDKKKKQRMEKAAEKRAAKIRTAKERGNYLKMESLRREIELGIINEKRFGRTWRDMVMNLKIPRIKEDLEVAWHTFDRALDIKNYSISLLLDEVDNAQEQYQVNERAHMETINRLMETYRVRLANEEKKYVEGGVREMVDEKLAETEAIAWKQTNDEVFLQGVMFAMEQRLEVLMKGAKGATISRVDEIVDSNRDFTRVAKFSWERKFREMWGECVANLTRYQTDTEDLRRDYNLAKEKDDRARRIIAKQLAQTEDLFESIRKFKEKIIGYKLTAAKEIDEILAERDFFNEAYWTVKTRFVSEQKADKDQLKIVTAEFGETRKQLLRLLAKGDGLLSLVRICRKYETLEEKVIPFKKIPGLDDGQEKLGIDFGWERSHAVMQEFRNLELFWRRIGSVKITTKRLRLERDKLREENRCLRECLEHCLTESSMPQESKTKN